MLSYRIIIGLLFLVGSCTSNNQHDSGFSEKQSSRNKAVKILSKCYDAHGGELYKTAHFSFVFRDKQYFFKNEDEEFDYRLIYNKEGKKIEDRLTNNLFERKIDGQQQKLSDEERKKLSNSLNSVIYFISLPHKLNDKSVNKEFVGTDTLNDKAYNLLKVTFTQAGGGDDFEDEYLYWINSESFQIDFLAYNYHVNGGGIRFRVAQNKRRVGGILFQDYINLKAPIGTPLLTLLTLYEKGKLEELSVIENSLVTALKKKSTIP